MVYGREKLQFFRVYVSRPPSEAAPSRLSFKERKVAGGEEKRSSSCSTKFDSRGETIPP